MNIDFQTQGSVIIALPKGRIDGLNAEDFENTLKDSVLPEHSRLIIDVSQVDYISSSGLRAILSRAKAMQRQERQLCLCSPSEPIGDLFRVSGFDRILNIYETCAAALAAGD